MQTRPTLTILLILTALCTSTQQADCNSTHFEYFSNYSLGKQEQLNITFDQIQPLMKVPPITYRSNDSASWTISEVVVKFKYVDSKQRAVIIGKDTVGIYGGFLEVTSAFKWEKATMIGKLNGTAQAKIQSGQVMFEKFLQIDEGYLDYKLASYYNVSFEFTNFTLTRIDPSTTVQSDIDNMLNALNVDKQSQSCKTAVQRQIALYFANYLSKNLKNNHYPLDDHFEYSWTNPWSKKTITIPYMLVPTGVDLEPAGLSMTFVSYIKDDANWKCGKAVPSQELNPKVYGGLQEFIEFSVFSNTIRYAFEKGMLDTELTRMSWQSKFFQFFAGDLYEVIPYTSNNFLAHEQVKGQCVYNRQQEIKVIKHNVTVLNTSTLHTCTLSIVGSKVAEFDVKLGLQVDTLSNQTNLNFKIINAEAAVSFKTVPSYQVKNKPLAEHMVMHSLNRMKEGLTFGSGWKIYPRDYSHVMMGDDYIVIYDTTHVEGTRLVSQQAAF